MLLFLFWDEFLEHRLRDAIIKLCLLKISREDEKTEEIFGNYGLAARAPIRIAGTNGELKTTFRSSVPRWMTVR